MKPPLLLPAGETREFQLQADYFEGQIDIKAFSARHPEYVVLASNPLVLEPERGRYVFLSRFGGVVFWDCPHALVDQIHRELADLPGLSRREEQARDTLVVHTGVAEERVGFSEVHLRGLTLEQLKVVSLALAQSVALDHFEGSVSRALARFQPVVAALASEGALLPPHREVLRIVGFAMEVRAAVLDNLTLFDDPPETWESESLSHLDSALYDQFDLEERLKAIQQKLAYLQDAGATFLNLLDTRKSQRLEWVIILLILVEILFFIWKEMLPPGFLGGIWRG